MKKKPALKKKETIPLKNDLQYLDYSLHSEEIRSNIMHLKIIDGIMVGEYYPPMGELNLETMEAVVIERYKFTNGRKFPFLLNVKNLKSISKKAREYSALDEVALDISCAALLVDKKFTKHLANFWLKINRPNTPTKLFTDEFKAFMWLTDQLDQ